MGGELTVGDFVTLIRGTTYKGDLVGKPGPALLGLGAIIPGGGFREGDYKTYGGECPANLMLYPGDLFVSLKGATKDGEMIGSVARVPKSVSSGRLTQDTVKLEFTAPAKQAKDYLYWLLRTPQYRDYCGRHATGSAVVALSRDDFLSYPVPPINETREKIVSLLELLEEKIELNRRMNATLEAMAQALFKSWFVDFDPVIDNALAAGNPIPEELQARADARAALGDKRKPLPEAIQKQFPSRFVFTEEMGWVPEGWNKSTVGAEFNVTMGQSPPGDTYNEHGDGVAFFQGRADFGFRYPSNRVFCTAPKRMANKGDTLVSVRAPVGDVNMAAADCCIGRGVSASRHKSGSRSFTYYSMVQLREHFKVYEAEGTVFGSINQNSFNSLPQLAIPGAFVSLFDTHAGAMDNRVENNCFENDGLERLRDTLLPKLLSGELRIPDAEKQVEEAV